MMIRRRSYPGGVPYSIRYPEIPLYAFLENAARKYPNRVAIIFYGKKIKYGQLWDKTMRLAASLKRLGVRKGNTVGLMLPNVPQFVIAFYATLAAGGVAVPINPLNPSNEVERELRETEVRTLIILDRLLKKMPEERPANIIIANMEAYLPQPLRLLNRLKRGRVEILGDAMRFNGLMEGPPLEEGEEIDPRIDLAVIQFTGGTTGPPKGVMLTHFNLVVNALQIFFWLRGWGYSGKPQPAGWPVVACAVPFFHIYGMTVALIEAIQFGSTLILIPKPQPEDIMRVVHRHASTHLLATPTMICGIVDHPRRSRYDLTSLSSCVSGGAPIDPAMVERFIAITGALFYQGYGLTEAGPVTHCTPINDPRPRSVGLPLPDTEAKIVDIQTGEVELPNGEEGELIIRGPQVMKGYWRNPGTTVLKDGWLYTGDIARIGENGYLYIVDRKMDRIISSGHNVWPSQVEEVLESHPSVDAAVSLGVLDPMRCATYIEAVVTLKPGCSRWDTTQVLMDLCRKRLKPYQAPSKITVVKSMPRTPLGKVDRLALRAELERST